MEAAENEFKKGNYSNAIKIYNKCLKAETKLNGLESIDNIVVHTKLGSIYRLQSNYIEAIKHYQAGLQIIENQKGPDHIDCIEKLCSIGEIYKSEGNID